jgi:hypothetical protein
MAYSYANFIEKEFTCVTRNETKRIWSKQIKKNTISLIAVEKTRYLGTDFIINEEVKTPVMNFEAISDRIICKIRLEGKYR